MVARNVHVFLWLLLAVSQATFTWADEAVPQLAGIVTDATGTPIAGAQVRIVGEKHLFMPVYRSRGMLNARSDAGGRYLAELHAEDLPLLSNHQPQVKVACWAPGKNLAVYRFPATRLMVAAEFDIELAPATSCRIRLVDSEGQPVANASVSPATISGLEFAFGELDFLTTTTDPDGNASFEGIDRDSLTQVYVDSQIVGHQSLTLIDENDAQASDQTTLIARALPVKKTSTHFVAPAEKTGEVEFNKIVASIVSMPSQNATSYIWHEVQADRSGRLGGIQITPGKSIIRPDLPYDFQYLPEEMDIQKDGDLPPIPLVQAALVTGRIVDAERGRGLANMYISQHSRDWRLSFTDADGRFSYWVKPGSHDGFFPQDPLGQYVSLRAFYIRPESLPDESGIIQAGEHRLSAMPQVVGKVVDADGQPVAAAQVSLTHQKERFTYDIPLFTDSKGEFRMYHAVNGTLVNLSSKTDTLRTIEDLEVLLDDEARPILKMQPIVRRTYSGRILDQDGQPVAGANIRFKQSTISVPETYSSEDRNDSSLYEENARIRTDADGRFISPPSGESLSTIAFEVEARGFRNYHSPWIDLTSLEADETTIDLQGPSAGFRLQPQAKQINCSVTVVSAQDEPLKGLRFVSLGAHSGLVQHVPESPEFHIELSDSPQMVGVIGDGHPPVFKLLSRVPDALSFVLLPNSASPAAEPQVTSPPNDDGLRRSLANDLLNGLGPVTKADTFYKRRLFFEATIYADQANALELMARGMVDEAGMSFGAGYMPLPLEFIEAILPQMGNDQAGMMMKLHAATMVEDDAIASQYIRDAVKGLEELAGTEKAMAVSRVACALIALSRLDQAQELLRECWAEQSALRELVNRDERQEDGRTFRGVARYFGPELALVDKRASMKFIELTAFAGEISWLRSEAVVFMANQGTPGWELVLEAFLDNKLNPAGIEGFLKKTEFTNIEQGLKLVELIDSHSVRALFLLHLIKHLDADSEHDSLELLERIAMELQQAEFDPGEPHPAQLAARASTMCYATDRQLSDTLLFEALWLCEGTYSILPYDTLCRTIAEFLPDRPDVVRHLLEPCFDDWSWLYTVRNSSLMFTNIQPLAAAALLDPEWAARLANQLMQEHLSGDRSRRLAVVYCLINTWARSSLNMNVFL